MTRRMFGGERGREAPAGGAGGGAGKEGRREGEAEVGGATGTSARGRNPCVRGGARPEAGTRPHSRAARDGNGG